MKKIIIVLLLTLSSISYGQIFTTGSIVATKINVDSLINGTAVMSVSYAELKTLIDSSDLVKGQYYLINDFATKHYYLDGDNTIDTAINTGTTEPLVVYAVDVNKLGYTAYSPSYPDDVIYYDYNSANWTSDISFSVGGTIITGWKGVIYYRSDTKNLITTRYDWRNVKLRRWAVTAPIYAGGTTYAKYAIVMGTDSAIYYSCVAGNVGNALTDRTKWRCMLDYNTNLDPYLQWGDTISVWGYMKEDVAMKEFKLASSTYKNVYTFGTNGNAGVRLSLGQRLSSTIVNNITFAVSGATYSDIEINDMCWNSSVSALTFYYCKFGKYFYNNIIAGGNIDDANSFEGFFQNTVGSYFSKNTMEVDFAQNIINSEFSSNNCQIGFKFNHVGKKFKQNSVGQICIYNTFGDSVWSNTMGSNFQYNKIKSTFKFNQVGHYFGSNTIAEECLYNVVGGNFYNNTVGNYFTDNIIGSNIMSCTIGDGVEFNVIPSQMVSKTIPSNRRYAYFMFDASYNWYYWKLLDNKLHLYNDNSQQIFTVDSTGITTTKKLQVGATGSVLDSIVASGDSLLFYYAGSKYKAVK